MANETFRVDLRADNIDEFTEDVLEYIRIRWNKKYYLRKIPERGEIEKKPIDEKKFKQIVEIVCAYFDVSFSNIRESTRSHTVKKSKIKIPRYFLMLLLHNENYTLGYIAFKIYSNYDHTNVIHGIRYIKSKMNDPTLIKTYQELSNKVNQLKSDGIQE